MGVPDGSLSRRTQPAAQTGRRRDRKERGALRVSVHRELPMPSGDAAGPWRTFEPLRIPGTARVSAFDHWRDSRSAPCRGDRMVGSLARSRPTEGI